MQLFVGKKEKRRTDADSSVASPSQAAETRGGLKASGFMRLAASQVESQSLRVELLYFRFLVLIWKHPINLTELRLFRTFAQMILHLSGVSFTSGVKIIMKSKLKTWRNKFII